YGNYYLTVTDANQCTAQTSGFVYETYSPFIVSLNTEICEGDSIELQVNSPSAISYQWSPNALNSQNAAITVTPAAPSESYTVTVTNDLGCTAVPDIEIAVTERPLIEISGTDSICTGQTTTLHPGTGGIWVSENPDIAVVSPEAVVTGISGGSAQFIFTSLATGCSSLPSAPVTIFPEPIVAVTGPDQLCVGGLSQLSPDQGGIWTSSNPSVATVDNQ